MSRGERERVRNFSLVSSEMKGHSMTLHHIKH